MKSGDGDGQSLTLIEIRAILAPFCVELTDDQIDKIREYTRLLLKWNKSVNLTAIEDPLEIIGRHFGESMYASRLLPVEAGNLVDVGSGGGFPGLALRILSPHLKVTVIESNKKKCVFLSEVVRALDLTNVGVVPHRYEEFRIPAGSVNFVTARALGGFSRLLQWSNTVLAARGHLVLWLGQDDSTTVSRAQSWVWQPAVKIPESQKRFILLGRPVRLP
jgi:16S rRNA (guanine527-N7)-methyltransferase